MIYKGFETLIKKIKKILKKVLTFLASAGIVYLVAGQESSDDNKKTLSGCGSAWLERLVWDQEVAGSNPVTPTKFTFAGVVQW